MSQSGQQVQADSSVLMEIIRTQAEIAKFGLDLGNLMEFIANRVKDMTQAGAAIIEVAEGEEMVYRAASGTARPELGLRLRRKGSLSGLCVDSGQILSCDDAETDDRVDREACRKVGLRSMVVAPLIHNGTPVGALKIASPIVAKFGAEDIQILELMSDLIAAAMFHAARYETDALYYRATHDALTGLANRAFFYDILRQALAGARRQQTNLGVLFVDLDGLKQINDKIGHRAGDAAICEAALRMTRASRESDTVARLGGDEFGLIVKDVGGRGGLVGQAARIGAEIRQSFAFEGQAVPLKASIGHALFPEDGTEVGALIEIADQAMYQMKRAGKPMPVPTASA